MACAITVPPEYLGAYIVLYELVHALSMSIPPTPLMVTAGGLPDLANLTLREVEPLTNAVGSLVFRKKTSQHWLPSARVYQPQPIPRAPRVPHLVVTLFVMTAVSSPFVLRSAYSSSPDCLMLATMRSSWPSPTQGSAVPCLQCYGISFFRRQEPSGGHCTGTYPH